MTSKKPSKKRSARKTKALRSSSGSQSPFKTRKSGKKECVLGTDPRRVAAILAGLDEMYPNATCELKHANPFQLLVSTILSAQCTDVRVNQVTESLYKKYPKPEAFAYATPSELEQEIRPTGFFRNKTKSVMGASKAIVEEFGGQVPRTMEEILTATGSRTQDSERGPGHSLRYRCGRRSRYACDQIIAASGLIRERASRQKSSRI